MLKQSDIKKPQTRKVRTSKPARFIMPVLAELEIKLSKVTESDFRGYAENNAIKQAKLVQTDEGYILIIELTWKEGEHTLYTFRDRPRTWASLDRIVAYMQRHELKLRAVTLELK